MEHPEYIIIFSVFLYAAVNLIYFYRRLVFDHFYKLSLQALIRRQQIQNGEIFFSSGVIKRVVAYLLRSPKKQAKKALLYLSFGRLALARNYLAAHGRDTDAALLEAYENPQQAINSLETFIKKNPQNYELKAELAALYFSRGNHAKARLLLDGILPKKAPRYTKAKYLYYTSFFNLAGGDMLSASQNLTIAAKLFNKEKAYFEEARAYLLIGTTYRVCCVEDVAQFMLETALKINQSLKNDAGYADVLGNLGMLMVLGERFDEAAAYFDGALEINLKLKREAASDIYNQRGLMFLLQKDYQEAVENIKTALKGFKNKKSKALGNELLGHIFYEQKKYREALKHAQEAEAAYKGDNLSAMLESMYLQAVILFEDNRTPESEAILRKVIAISKKNNSSFHPANAYTLLGLIFLRRKELRRAKGLFQQSLALEQKDERLSGIATDYANIGLIELRSGNREQARKTLQTALEYAEVYGENELSKIIKKRLQKLDT